MGGHYLFENVGRGWRFFRPWIAITVGQPANQNKAERKMDTKKTREWQQKINPTHYKRAIRPVWWLPGSFCHFQSYLFLLAPFSLVHCIYILEWNQTKVPTKGTIFINRLPLFCLILADWVNTPLFLFSSFFSIVPSYECVCRTDGSWVNSSTVGWVPLKRCIRRSTERGQ